jgi:hypothetical protein
MKKFWKYSRLRFYILNFIWNVKFWLFSEKVFKDEYYNVDTSEYEMDYTFKLINKQEQRHRRRFVGYMYKNSVFLDNPGIQGIEQDVMNVWKKKKLF